MHITRLGVVIHELCRSINWEEWAGRGKLTSFCATHYKNTKICHNIPVLWFLFLFCWSKIYFISKIVTLKFQVRSSTPLIREWSVDVLQIMQFKESHLKLLGNACKDYLNLVLFFLSFLFLLITSDKVARSYLFRQDLRICVL